MYRGGGRALSGAVRALLIANAVVFLGQSILRVWGPRAPLSESQFIEIFGLVPALTLLHGWIWQPITYLFLHGSLFHLLLNLLMLWMFGAPLERAWGTRRFLRYYFVCGVGAAALTCMVAFSSRTIGASGALFGLLLAYGMMWPEQVLLIWGIVPMRAKTLVWVAAALELYSLIFGGNEVNIAYGAHLGGMLVGYLMLGRAWRVREALGSLRWKFRRRRFRVMRSRDPNYPFH
jgi:membrane associated rhomboid family serine protease